MLSALFGELSCDKMQAVALERFGYFLGRWVYLMDAADDLMDDLKEGAFNPFIPRLGLSGKKELSCEERKAADEAMNQALNATAAQMLLAFQLIDTQNFGPILENVVEKGLPEIQREILFLHIRERKTQRSTGAGGPALTGLFFGNQPHGALIVYRIRSESQVKGDRL